MFVSLSSFVKFHFINKLDLLNLISITPRQFLIRLHLWHYSIVFRIKYLKACIVLIAEFGVVRNRNFDLFIIDTTVISTLGASFHRRIGTLTPNFSTIKNRNGHFVVFAVSAGCSRHQTPNRFISGVFVALLKQRKIYLSVRWT